MSLKLSALAKRYIRPNQKLALSILTLICAVLIATSTSTAQTLSRVMYESGSYLISYLSGSGGQDDTPGKGGAQTNFTESAQYTQGFETDGVWSPTSTVTRVPSGTNGVTSRTGGFHGEVGTNFTQWGGYNATFPSQGYTTSVSVYLNVGGGFANNTRFDWDSAINDSTGNFRRDYIFNAGYYNDSDVTGTGPRFVISASNNSQPGSAFAKDPSKGPFTITTSGWYTFKHRFYNNGGVLAVQMSIVDSSNVTINSWIRSNPADTIATTGGNRYGWFDFNQLPFLAIDDSGRSNIVQDPVVKVRAASLNGWTPQVVGATAAGDFVAGPTGQPLGSGSYRSTIGADGDDFTRTHNAGFSGVRLDQISTLSYSTYVAAHFDSQAHYLSFRIDFDGDTTYDDTIYFEPAYQTAANFPAFPQPALALNTWQTWNARNGGWWSAGGIAGATPGAGVKSLAQYLAVKPNARIMNEANGGVRIIAGGGNPSWNNFDGAFDNFVIGVAGDNKTYDFEPPITTVVDDDGMGTAANCDAAVPSSSTIADAYSVAGPGDTITVCPGTYTLPGTVAISKANLTIVGAGPARPVIQAASSIGNAFFIGAPGVTLQNLEIKKTDLPNQELIAVQGDNFTASNNLIYGPDPGTTWDVAGIVSRGFVISANNNINLIGNTIHHLRQPAYISGGAATGGNITGNNVSGTKGWVVEGGNYLFTANTFGEPQNQSCDIALLATLAPLNNAFYEPLLALSSNNDNAFICAQYGTPVNGRAIAYVDSTPALGNGSDNQNYTTIQAGIDGTLPGGTVQVAAGGYSEDVVVNKSVKVIGDGQATTTISGPLTGSSSTVAVAANGVEISGFTITRLGNNTTDWNTTVKTVGLSVQGGFTGMNIHDNRFTGNRSGIDINNSSGHSIHNNTITDNRTGLIMRNQTDSLSIVQNEITNNWTVGLLFLDGSGGSNVPVQRCLGCGVSNNSFSGNWYGAIVDRQSGGALPAPGTNLKNFGSNWLGTNTPVVTTANTTEPGYAAQIPVEFGGSAVPPGGQPDIAGPASANFDYSPFLDTGVDTSGTYGFQGSFATLNVASASPQAAAGTPSNIQEGIDLIAAGGNLKVGPGTYAGNVNVNKAVNLKGIFTVGGTLTTSAAGAALSPGNSPGIINSGDLSLGSGTTVNMELNGTTVGTQYDQLNVTGTVSIAPNVVLNVTTGFSPGVGSTFTIVNNDGADAVSGTFKDMPEGTVFYVGANSFSISYIGGTGNDIVLSTVSLCNAVSIPTNITSQTATTVVVPINVDDTTGHGLVSTDFDLTYNSAVLSSPVVSLTGSITNGSVLTVNNPSPGLLRVSIFNSTPFAGAGMLATVTFNVVGLPGSSSPVSFTAFKFNEGTPCISTSNGLVTVVSGTITGTVTYGNALVGPAPPRFVPNVSITGTGSPTVSTTTNGSGTYSLGGFGPGTYTRSASKVSTTGPGSDASAVSSFDAAKIAQHVVGIAPLTGNQLIVADVSGFGGITSFDAALIARYTVLLPGAGLTGNWVFVPPSYGPSTVFANISGENYSALLMGDVTGNWGAAGPFRMAPAPDKKPTTVDAPSMTAASGSEVIVPVTARGTTGKEIVSYQFELRYDPAVLEPTATPVDTQDTLSGNLLVTANGDEPGLLRVSVFGAMPLSGDGVLLNIRFRAIGAAGAVSPLSWEGLVLNEGAPISRTTDGQVQLTAAAPDQSELDGRLLTALGGAVANTRVTITDTAGASRSVLSNGFGYFRFGGLHAGETYTVSADNRRYRFTPITVSISGTLTSVDMIADQ